MYNQKLSTAVQSSTTVQNFSMNAFIAFCISGQSLTHRRDLLSACKTIAGPSSPPVDYCLDPGSLEIDPCDLFIQEVSLAIFYPAWPVLQSCTYLGLTVFDQKGVIDSYACQQLLISLGNIFDANTFIFREEDEVNESSCQFLDTFAPECDAISGPRIPGISSCNGAPTLPSTPPVQTTTTRTATSTTTTTTTTISTTSQITNTSPGQYNPTAVLWFGGSIFTPNQQRYENIWTQTVICCLPDSGMRPCIWSLVMLGALFLISICPIMWVLST